MKLNKLRVAAAARQRAWSSSPNRSFVSIGRLANLVKRGIKPSPAEIGGIGRSEGFRFITSPVLKA